MSRVEKLAVWFGLFIGLLFLLVILSEQVYAEENPFDTSTTEQTSLYPSMFMCLTADGEGNLFFVYYPADTSYIFFNDNGVYINHGIFQIAETSEGATYLYAQVGQIWTKFAKVDEGVWILTVMTPDKNTDDLLCK